MNGICGRGAVCRVGLERTLPPCTCMCVDPPCVNAEQHHRRCVVRVCLRVRCLSAITPRALATDGRPRHTRRTQQRSNGASRHCLGCVRRGTMRYRIPLQRLYEEQRSLQRLLSPPAGTAPRHCMRVDGGSDWVARPRLPSLCLGLLSGLGCLAGGVSASLCPSAAATRLLAACRVPFVCRATVLTRR